MKKLFSIATILILVFSLFCISCTQEPEQNPTDNMTESYRAARQSIHDSSNIWLPELEGVEITKTDITENGAKPLVNISFAGDETLFNQLATYLNEKIGINPDMSEANMKWWEMEYTDNGQIYVGNISIYLNQGIITIASHFFRGFTVTLTASPAAGGTVSFKLAGTPVAGPSLTEAENSDMDLVATPATGYEFAGWYRNNTLVSDKANYTDFKVPSENVTIEARFSEKQTAMTDYYAAGRQKYHQIHGIWLPELEGVGSENTADDISHIEQDWSATNITFDLAGGITEDACNALLAFMKTQYGDNPTENHDTSMDPIVYDYQWTSGGNWYQLHYQVGDHIYLNSHP